MARKQIINPLVGFAQRSIGPYANRIGPTAYFRSSGGRIPNNWQTRAPITLVDWVTPGYRPEDWSVIIPGSQFTLVPEGSEPEGYVPGGGRCIMLDKADSSDRIMEDLVFVEVDLIDDSTIIDVPVYQPGPWNEEDQGAQCGIVIQIASGGNGTNQYTHRFDSGEANPRQGWVTWSFPLQTLNNQLGFRIVNAPDVNALDYMRVALENSGSTGAESKYAFMGPIRARRRARTLVSINFDDGKESMYDTAYPIMEPRGLKGAIAIINNTVGNTGKMTWEQIKELYDDGWSVMAHGADSFNYRSATEPQVLADMTDSVTDLRARNFPTTIYTWPGGAYTEYSKSVARDLDIDACFDIGNNFVKSSFGITTGDYGSYPRVAAEDVGGTTLALQYVNEAVRIGYSCFLYMHDIVSGPSGPNTTNITEFTELMDELVALRDQGYIDVVIPEQWISGLV